MKIHSTRKRVIPNDLEDFSLKLLKIRTQRRESRRTVQIANLWLFPRAMKQRGKFWQKLRQLTLARFQRLTLKLQKQQKSIRRLGNKQPFIFLRRTRDESPRSQVFNQYVRCRAIHTRLLCDFLNGRWPKLHCRNVDASFFFRETKVDEVTDEEVHRRWDR